MARIDVSLILPVYNETARLVSGLSDILEYLEGDVKRSKNNELRSKKKNKVPHFSWEIIMVDDGSHVPAAEVINHSHLQKTVFRLIQEKKFKGFQTVENKGKGAAIAEGVKQASGKYVVFMDIDGSVPVTMLPVFISSLHMVDIAVGSRRIPDSVIAVHQPWMRETGGRIYTYLSRMLFHLPVHDATCGFKAFRSDAAKELFSQARISRWAFDTEVLALAHAHGYTLQEIPVRWMNKEGSKVKFGDTVESFLDLFKIIGFQLTGAYTKTTNNSTTSNTSQTSNTVHARNSMRRASLSKSSMVCDSCGSSSFTFLFDHHHEWKVQQCTVCGLAQVIPRPSKKEVAALYANDEHHFDPYIDQEDVHRAYFHQKLIDIDQPLSSNSSQSLTRHRPTLLDVGCLTGVLIDEAGKMGMNALGLDISKDAVDFCKRHGLNAYNGTIEVYDKRFPGKKFDVITALEIIEHEHSPRTLVTTMYKKLHKNGVAVVSTPNHGSWWRQVMGKKWPGYTHKEHLYFFDTQSIEYIFKEAGFTSVTVKTGDSRPFPLWFLFKRGADYFPEFAPLLKVISLILRPFPLMNPINPWDDLLVIARK